MDLFKEVTCPVCGAKGARKVLWKIICLNPVCGTADPGAVQQAKAQQPSAPPPPAPLAALKGGSFDPGPRALQIRYRNYRGEEKTFTADRATGRRKRRRVSFRLAPTGRRVSFATDRILNWPEVEAAIRPYPQPKGVEAQILGYYRKHGGSSPRYESLRKQFPGF